MHADDVKTRERVRPADGDRFAAAGDPALRRIAAAIEGIRYGSVLVIVQDGVVVQIERTEKTRLTR